MPIVQFEAPNLAAPPQPSLPRHTDEGLLSDVGTTRLPRDLSWVSRTLLRSLAIYNIAGISWGLWGINPIAAILLAACIGMVTLSLASLYHSSPYLDSRRAAWAKSNRWLLNAAFGLSVTATSLVSWGLISNPPSFKFPELPARLHGVPSRSVDAIRRDLRLAGDDCVYRGWRCDQREDLAVELKEARRKAEIIPAKTVQPIDEDNPAARYALYVAAVAAALVSHWIAATGPGSSSETNFTIWQESVPPPPGPKKPEPPKVDAPPPPPDEGDKATIEKKDKGFDQWAELRVSIKEGAKIKAEDAHKLYKAYVEKEGFPVFQLHTFGTRMTKRFGPAFRTDGSQYEGLEIKEG